MCRRISCWLLSVLVWGCTAKDSLPDVPGPVVPDEPSGPDATVVSVAYVKSFYRGYPFPIDEEWELHGVVSANDRYGTFPRTLVVQDAGGGIEIKAGGDGLFELFPVGQSVRLSCRGLVLGGYGGMVSLGAASDDPAYENGFIGRESLLSRLKTDGGMVDLRPSVLTFADLEASHVGMLVAFEDVQFVEGADAVCWGSGEQDTDRHLVDRAGDTLIVRVPRQADFVSRTLPSGSGYIEGILSVFGRRYQLKVVSPKNMTMESPRFVSRSLSRFPVAGHSITCP